MTIWIVAAGVLSGLGCFTAVVLLWPARPRLDAALARMRPGQAAEPGPPWLELCRRLGAASRAGVPVADLDLLGTELEHWAAAKLAAGLAGLGLIPVLALLASLAGIRLGWSVPAGGALAAGALAFFAPDLITARTAARRRADFRSALASYLDLVALERGAGAGPTHALEAAADIGDGWAFARIAAALAGARRAGRPPWDGLASLGERTGVPELADLADIAEIAGQEGASILRTLGARADSMRAEALAASRARARARSTVMVVPIALLGAGFLLLVVFPIAYRTFG
ncbi:MAG: type II secretion system F family protein [Streptosporangiaceae bacterium]